MKNELDGRLFAEKIKSGMSVREIAFEDERGVAHIYAALREAGFTKRGLTPKAKKMIDGEKRGRGRPRGPGVKSLRTITPPDLRRGGY